MIEAAMAILLLILCGLVILETRGYAKYIDSQKLLISSYEAHNATLIALIKVVNAFEEKLNEHIEHINLVEGDYDIIHTMVDLHSNVLGIKLPHLEEQLHKHQSN